MQNPIKTLGLAALSIFCHSVSAMTDAQVHQILDEVAAEYRANLPETVNANTMLYGARRDLTVRRRLVYLYRIDTPRSALSLPLDTLAAQQKEESLAYFCSQPALEPFREIDVSFEYNYSDSDKQYLFSVYLDPSECPEGHSKDKTKRMTKMKSKRKKL